MDLYPKPSECVKLYADSPRKTIRLLTNAAFFFEAALQLEQNPENRYEALNNLSPCYMNLGKGDDAKKIFTALRDRDKPKLFHLFPERGF